MKLTPCELNKRSLKFDRPYLIRIEDNYYVGYLEKSDGHTYFVVNQGEMTLSLKDVDEVMRIEQPEE